MNIEDANVHILRNRNYPNHSTDLSDDPEYLVTGYNSGYQALNLAVLAGVRAIILLGMDGAPSKDGKTHWHDAHMVRTPATAFPLYVKAMKEGAPTLARMGVRVLNCSPGSAIGAFERMPLENAVELCA